MQGRRNACPTPKAGHEELKAGNSRNFQVFKPFDFLAEVTQLALSEVEGHIPNKGEHQVRYYGWYSNKKRGMAAKAGKVAGTGGAELPDVPRHTLSSWAMLIRLVYEADPLKCPECGGAMKIISFIEQEDVIRKILVHCELWTEGPVRPPPVQRSAEPVALETTVAGEYLPDYSIFEDTGYAD